MISSRRLLAFVLVLILLCLAASLNTLPNGFVLDDHRAIVSNRCVVQRPALACVWTSDFWGRPLSEVGRSYRPLVTLSFALDWWLAGGAPWLFHLTNALLHLLTTLVVFFLLRTFSAGKRLLAPAVGAAIFAVLAIHTEAVASLVGRADLMATLLVTAALCLHLRSMRQDEAPSRRLTDVISGNTRHQQDAPEESPGADEPKPARHAPLDSALRREMLLLLFYVAALLCHELAILLPGFIVAIDMARGDITGSGRLRRYAGLALISGLYLAVRPILMGHVLGPPPDVLNNPAVTASLDGRILLGLSLIHRSISLMLVPLELSAEYGWGAITIPASFFSGPVLLGGVLLLVLSTLFWTTRKRTPLLAAGSALLGLSVLLLSNVPVILPTVFGERLLYLPTLGLVLMAAGGVELAQRRGLTRPAFAVALVIIALNLLLSISRNRDWHDEVRLFSSAVQTYPRSARAQLNLGLALNSVGLHQQALSPLARALKIRPDLHLAARQMAIAYDLLNLPHQAEAIFLRLYQQDPSDPALIQTYIQFLRRHGQHQRVRQIIDAQHPVLDKQQPRR